MPADASAQLNAARLRIHSAAGGMMRDARNPGREPAARLEAAAGP
jgi:hypothetical protein